MSIIQSMSIAQQALQVNQGALSIVSNNIANMNTAGYHKQRAELATNTNYTPIGNNVYSQIGSMAGVQIDKVLRYSDMYLQNYYREQNTDYAYLNQSTQLANSVETLMNELAGTGLEKAFTSFYEAVNNLNQNPDDSTARLNYMEQAKSVAQKFNELANSLDKQRADLVGDINIPGSIDQSKADLTVKDVNQMLEEIAKVNKDILRVSSGGLSPNNLLDTRDQLLSQLSSLIPIEVKENSDGTVAVSLNGLNLVKGTEVKGNLTLKTGDANTPAIVQLVDENGRVVADELNDIIDSGSLGAILDMASTKTDMLTIAGVKDKLDTLAQGFAEIINTIQTQTGAMAIDPNTMTLVQAADDIFVSSDGNPISASNIKINDDVYNDPYKIAAAKVDPADYDPKAIGNGNNMLEVTKTRTGSFASLDGSNPEGFLATLVGDIGLKKESVETSLKNQKLVMQEVSNQLSSVTGVNLDEELLDLTKYQRAYEASARIFNVCDQILQLLVNLGN